MIIYLARIAGDDGHKVELRSEQPTDTPLWLGPYTLEEVWASLAPKGNPLNYPEITVKSEEWAGSHGMKPIDFHAKYDPESKSIILFDFGGYVGTVSTPASLWKALVYQSEHGLGSLRTLTRVPGLPNSRYISPEEQAKINEEIAEFQRKAAAQQQVKPKPGKISLSDLGLDL